MSYRKNSLVLAGIMMIVVLVISACTQSYSQTTASTPTLIPTGLFVSPFPSVENPMAMIEEFAKGTATANALLTATAIGGTPGTPETPQAEITGTVITPETDLTETPTPTESTPGTPTNAIATTPVVAAITVTPGGPTLTPLPPGFRPTSYTLQKGEFPYCIARRFDVNPNELLTINGLTSGNVFMPGLTLKIPQSGNPFPPPRSLRNHPDTYTVTGSGDETVYGVACKYGDVDPALIAQTNGISISAALTIGQQVKIP